MSAGHRIAQSWSSHRRAATGRVNRMIAVAGLADEEIAQLGDRLVDAQYVGLAAPTPASAHQVMITNSVPG